jgi:hypothetical protein
LAATLGCLSRFRPVEKELPESLLTDPGRFDPLAALGYGLAAAPGILPQRPTDILNLFEQRLRRLPPMKSLLDKGARGAGLTSDTATSASGHRFIVMPQVSWQTMMKEFPAAHVVSGLLPSEDAAVGLAGSRSFLLGRLARILCPSGMYAIAEIVERDGTHVQCALASARDAAELAETVSASDSGCYSHWASRRKFLFDDAAAKAIEHALSRQAPAEAHPLCAKPLALP